MAVREQLPAALQRVMSLFCLQYPNLAKIPTKGRAVHVIRGKEVLCLTVQGRQRHQITMHYCASPLTIADRTAIRALHPELSAPELTTPEELLAWSDRRSL